MSNNSSLPPFEPKEIPELRRKGRHARNALLLYFVAGLAVAFLTPENILEHEWARGFVNLMSFIPYVDKVGQASFAHPVAPFFAAVMFVLSMAVMWPLLRSTSPFLQEIVNRRIRVHQILKYAGLVFVLITFLAWQIFYPSFNYRLGRLQISSRIGMGMYGTILLAALPFFSMVVVTCFKNWRHIVYGDMNELIKRNSNLHQ